GDASYRATHQTPSRGFDTTSAVAPLASVTRRPGSSVMTLMTRLISHSKKHSEVLCEQYRLIEDHFPAGDLPSAVRPAQDVFPLSDEDVRLGRDAVSIDQEPALDLELRRVRDGRCRFEDLDVRDHVRRPRLRLLGPVHA